jgi:hypothetical protein
LEFRTVLISLDSQENHQQKLMELAREGWMLVPGIPPQAIYQLCKQPGAQPQPGMNVADGIATLAIDESKIGVLRDGKLVQ